MYPRDIRPVTLMLDLFDFKKTIDQYQCVRQIEERVSLKLFLEVFVIETLKKQYGYRAYIDRHDEISYYDLIGHLSTEMMTRLEKMFYQLTIPYIPRLIGNYDVYIDYTDNQVLAYIRVY